MPKLAHDKCVICGDSCPAHYSEDPNSSDTNAPRSHGGIITLSFGYGSRLDTEYVYGVICDECARAFVETAAEPLTSGGRIGTTFKNIETIDEE